MQRVLILVWLAGIVPSFVYMGWQQIRKLRTDPTPFGAWLFLVLLAAVWPISFLVMGIIHLMLGY